MTTDFEPPSPLKITGPLTSVFSSAALLAALQLELFTALGEDVLTVDELAARMQVGPRRLRAVLNVLVIGRPRFEVSLEEAGADEAPLANP